MGSSYQTVLATGDLVAIRAAVAVSAQEAVIIPVGNRRWAVVPAQEDGYAEVDDLAELLSLAEGSVAAAFDVLDSDVIVAKLYRNGECYHEYLSEQGYLTEMWDDDDNEFMVDMLGRSYPPEVTPPSGPLGADPAAFAPLGVEPIDRTDLGEALSGPEVMAEVQHHAILHALNIDPDPLAMRYEQARDSGLAV